MECQSAQTRPVIRDLPVFGVDLAAGAGFCAWLIRQKMERGANRCGKGAAELQEQVSKLQGFAGFKHSEAFGVEDVKP